MERGVVVTSERFEAASCPDFAQASRRKRIESITKIIETRTLSSLDTRASWSYAKVSLSAFVDA